MRWKCDVSVPPEPARLAWADLPFLAGVCATLGVIFRELVAGRVLAGGDLQLYFFPYWSAAAWALQAGKLPLWNPHLFAGAPFLANSQAGVFYPLNWPLWLLSGPTLAGTAHSLHWSVLLHVVLAACTAYLLARRLGVDRWGAALAGLLYAGGGYLGLHVEHLNQLQGLAWLPLVLLPPARQRVSPLNVLALALILLAGHTQTAFIAAVGVVVFRGALWMAQAAGGRRQVTSSKQQVTSNKRQAAGGMLDVSRIPHSVVRFIPFTFAALIAAPQLWPTFELSRFSMRAGGLPWREAVSFSLSPWEAHRALLPAYLVTPLLPEGVAYLGLIGLALAGWGVWRAWRDRRSAARASERLALVALAGMGLFLAMGGYNPLYLLAARLGVPGIVHFRAPARFLALYALGAALLAGGAVGDVANRVARWGSQALSAKRHWNSRLTFDVFRHAGVTVVSLLVALELGFSAARLPHADATALRAYTDLRPATAHLVAAAREAEAAGLPPGRFLSISQALFDPGDKAAIEAMHGASLSPDALWAYLVAAKNREVLSPNLPLAFGVPAVDGYDGGLLPLRHYADFTRLLLPEGTLDGRLRENLQAIPDGRWLSLLNVRFLITDKTGDAWADGIFYDRQFQPALAPGETLTLAWLPGDFAADALGVLYTGAGAVELAFADGRQILPLPVAAEAETPYRVRWDAPATPLTVTLRAGATGLALAGASLLDECTGSFYPLALSDRFRLVHSGDVKIYENLVPLPRAFLIHQSVCVGDDAAALEVLRAPGFDPATQGVVQDCGDLVATLEPLGGAEATRIVSYAPEQVVVEVHAAAAGLLVLTDAWYPGWEATVEALDGTPAPLVSEPLRVDVLFRATPVAPGDWRVTFTYRPALWPGVFAALVGALGLWGYSRITKPQN